VAGKSSFNVENFDAYMNTDVNTFIDSHNTYTYATFASLVKLCFMSTKVQRYFTHAGSNCDAQKSDPFCIEIMQDPNVMDGSDSPFTVRDSIGENFDKPYFKMPNGILMHRYYNAAGVGVCYQTVVPEKYHMQIIKHIHYSSVAGHLAIGIAKTRAMILKAGFWFPHMLAKVICAVRMNFAQHGFYKISKD